MMKALLTFKGFQAVCVGKGAGIMALVNPMDLIIFD